MEKRAWLSKEVFDWYVSYEGGRLIPEGDFVRAYEIWSHAERILLSGSDEFHRVDSILALKRCLNQRLKFIEQIYNLKQIALPNSPRGYLEYLETFNVVRPLMLKKLLEVRNDIEHNDAEPPGIERCLELLDMCWYFLKSTDGFLRCRRDNILYNRVDENGEESHYGFGVKIIYDLNHKIEMSGWFPSELIHMTESSNGVGIIIDVMHTKEEKCVNDFYHKEKLADDVWIVGCLDCDAKVRFNIIKDALNAND